MVAAARLTESGFAAIAVMNIPDVIVEVWNTVVITYEPIFFSVPLVRFRTARHAERLGQGQENATRARRERG